MNLIVFHDQSSVCPRALFRAAYSPGGRGTYDSFYFIVLLLFTADFSSPHLCLFFLAKLLKKKEVNMNLEKQPLDWLLTQMMPNTRKRKKI